MRRYTDYRVNIIRYNDGISDVAQKIKQKATDLYKQFKQLKSGQKIAYLLAKLIQYMSAIYAGVSLAKLGKLLKETKKVTVEIKNANGDWVDATRNQKLSLGLKALCGLLVSFLSIAAQNKISAGLPDGYGRGGRDDPANEDV